MMHASLHAHPPTPTHPCSRIHTELPRRNVHIHTRTHINSHTYMHTHTHTHPHPHTYTHTYKQTNKQMNKHTPAHTHTHTHTHTQTPPYTYTNLLSHACTNKTVRQAENYAEHNPDFFLKMFPVLLFFAPFCQSNDSMLRVMLALLILILFLR
jgi:hypothetical protein